MLYEFTADWFSHHVPVWQQHLASLRGRAGLRYLEVGVFEGRSLFWLLDNILTAPNAHATAVDAFFALQPNYEATFRANLARCPTGAKVDVVKGDSADVLRALPLASYDLAYIDAGHGQRALFVDLALTWGVLAEGGLLILDDYGMGVGRMPRNLRPGPVVDTFLDAVALEVEVIHRGYQLILKRVPMRSARAVEAAIDLPPHAYEICTQVGDWYYFWHDRRLVRVDGSDGFILRRRLIEPFEWAIRSGRGALALSLLTRVRSLLE